MANIVVVISKGLITHADLPPAGTSILLAVERQSRGERKRQRLAHRAWVQLSVHIEGKMEGSIVRAAASKTRNAIVLLGVDRGDREGIFEEERVGHVCEHWTVI